MQRRRKPRFLPCKISIQPSPGTLKHRRSRTICRTHRRHAASTRNCIGAFNMFRIFFEKRGAKMLLSLKPKPRQTAAISGKQDFAQRRNKRRRDHQRLLSKLRKHNTANCADNPNRPQSHPRQQARTRRSCRPRPTVPQGGRRKAPKPPPGSGPATATCPHISPAAPTNNGPIAGRLQQRHRRRGPDRSHYSQSSLAIWTALVAAPLRIWSPQHQKVMPRAASGFEMSRRTRPTQIRS